MSSITDVAGILVGHHQRLDPDATLGAGWGSRETDLLDPANSVRYVDALVLAGGSAYGLAAADGVMAFLEEQRRGVSSDAGVVPIVPAAVIFDLPVGGWDRRPTAEFGLAACNAAVGKVSVGTVGAGVGARAGPLKGGTGTASVTLDLDGAAVTVGALVVVNSAGEVADPATGLPWPAYLIEEFGLIPPPAEQVAVLAGLETKSGPLNTTIAAVATDAALSPAGCRRVAIAAQDGLARTIRPAHTPVDGDIVFALATGAVEVPPPADTPAALSPETGLVAAVGAAAADSLARAVLVGVLAAEPVAGIPTYRATLPGAFANKSTGRP